MGIETFSEPERVPKVNIEGERISIMREVPIDQAENCPLWDIVWKGAGAALIFKKLDFTYLKRGRFGNFSIPLYQAEGIFYDADGQTQHTNLSTLTKRKTCLFTGCGNGFYMHDPDASGQDTDFYVLGLNPYELKESLKHNDGTWHEIGHALLVDGLYDSKLMRSAYSQKRNHLPEVALASMYGSVAAQSIPESARGKDYPLEAFTQRLMWQLYADNYGLSKALSLFHERNAWAAGYHLQNNLGFPSGFHESVSRKLYADFCLESYAIANHDSRFVNGLHD